MIVGAPYMSITDMTKSSQKPSPNKPTGDLPVASKSTPEFSTLSVHAGEARQKPGDSINDPIFCA